MSWIPWIAASFIVISFMCLLRMFGLVERSKEVISVTRHSINIIWNTNLTDDEKEMALQKHAKRLFGHSFIFLIGGAAAVFLPIGLLWVAEYKGFLSLPEVFQVAMSPIFLILSTIFAVLALFIPFRRKLETTNYSFLDRILHKIAFKTIMAQISVSDMEDRIFADQIKKANADQPVFITALPRTGTTLLLESLAQLNEFASHCYRDMPFVITPFLWSRFSERFRQSSEMIERAHGDGMRVDVNSPEALEEVIWKAFWKKQYRKDRILPWPEENNEEFTQFFQNHMKKIVALRRPEGIHGARYISKNNLNIARIPMIRRMFPNAVLIIPFRDPLHHASSLLEQHRNFLCIHDKDAFAADYMRAIGHFDFGIHLRPVDFGNWYDQDHLKEPRELTFWLTYWAACYRHLLNQTDNAIHFFNYRKLCESPEHGLTILSELTHVMDKSALLKFASTIRPARKRDIDVTNVSPGLLKTTEVLFEELEHVSCN